MQKFMLRGIIKATFSTTQQIGSKTAIVLSSQLASSGPLTQKTVQDIYKEYYQYANHQLTLNLPEIRQPGLTPLITYPSPDYKPKVFPNNLYEIFHGIVWNLINPAYNSINHKFMFTRQSVISLNKYVSSVYLGLYNDVAIFTRKGQFIVVDRSEISFGYPSAIQGETLCKIKGQFYVVPGDRLINVVKMKEVFG